MSRVLFPKISTNQQLWLSVDDEHQIYVEQSGNLDGIPVIYLHGGPGGGCNSDCRRYFDPEKYNILLYDQRGCGRSIPSPCLSSNTIWDLVNDLEIIREHFSIKRWLVAGGSWGTTLALTYGIKHSDRVKGFILRGIFLGTQVEYDWLYQPMGAARFFPEYYREFIEHLPIALRKDPLSGYYQILTGDNEVAVISASKAWCLWELRLSTIEHHHIDKTNIQDNHQALCMAKISSHYFQQSCFLKEDNAGEKNYLLKHIKDIAHLPAIILHGRYDMVCQLAMADLLVQDWHHAQLQILPCAGHSGFESQTIDAFCKASDTMAKFFEEKEQ
jgi:proline iminopeptidase